MDNLNSIVVKINYIYTYVIWKKELLYCILYIYYLYIYGWNGLAYLGYSRFSSNNPILSSTDLDKKFINLNPSAEQTIDRFRYCHPYQYCKTTLSTVHATSYRNFLFPVCYVLFFVSCTNFLFFLLFATWNVLIQTGSNFGQEVHWTGLPMDWATVLWAFGDDPPPYKTISKKGFCISPVLSQDNNQCLNTTETRISLIYCQISRVKYFIKKIKTTK